MKQYRVIIEDHETYDFVITLPDGLSDDEIDEAIWEHLAEDRSKYWRSGEESIVACDDISNPHRHFSFVKDGVSQHPNKPASMSQEYWSALTPQQQAFAEIRDFIDRHLLPREVTP